MTAPTNRSELLTHYDGLRALARMLAHEDAEDHVQDTYVAALSNAEPRSPGPWMRQVLRNSVRDQARRRLRRRELEHYVEPPPGPELPEDQVADDEVARLLRDVLEEVGEPYQRVLELRYFEDRSAAEIARELDIPPGTVRWRCHEGLERVRVALDERSDAQRPWRGLLLSFAGPSTGLELAAPSGGGGAVFGLRYAVIGSLILAAVAVALTTALSLTNDRRGNPSAAQVELETAPTPVRATDREPQAATEPKLPRGPTGAAVSPASVPAPTSSQDDGDTPSVDPRAEAKACMVEAIAAFNAGEGEGEEAVAQLVEAANCAEDAHMIGQSVQISRVLLERYPDSVYAKEAEASLGRLFSRVVDAEAGLDTEWGQDCVAPLEHEQSLNERLAAASCLDDAALFGAALELRRSLVDDLDAASLGANQEAIELLEGNIAKYREMGAEWLPEPTQE